MAVSPKSNTDGFKLGGSVLEDRPPIAKFYSPSNFPAIQYQE